MFNTQKKYFQKKIDAITKMIWDLEFKRFKIQEQREEHRANYDNLKGQIYNLEQEMKRQDEMKDSEGKLNKDERARMDDEKIRMEKEMEKQLEWMKGLDVEIAGSKQTAEMPEGAQGINQQVDALHELKGTIKDWIKQL